MTKFYLRSLNSRFRGKPVARRPLLELEVLEARAVPAGALIGSALPSVLLYTAQDGASHAEGRRGEDSRDDRERTAAVSGRSSEPVAQTESPTQVQGFSASTQKSEMPEQQFREADSPPSTPERHQPDLATTDDSNAAITHTESAQPVESTSHETENTWTIQGLGSEGTFI